MKKNKLKKKYEIKMYQGLEKKYNKNMLSAISYFAIGTTLIFSYFIKIEEGFLLFGIILCILGGFIYKISK